MNKHTKLKRVYIYNIFSCQQNMIIIHQNKGQVNKLHNENLFKMNKCNKCIKLQSIYSLIRHYDN